jgi:hypothetical protein
MRPGEWKFADRMFIGDKLKRLLAQEIAGGVRLAYLGALSKLGSERLRTGPLKLPKTLSPFLFYVYFVILKDPWGAA